MRTNTRRRLLGRVLLTVLAVLGGLVVGVAPAQAVATYSQVCPGYAHADNEPIRDGAGNVIGQVHVGVNDSVGRVCVATIKHRWVGQSSRTIARIDVYLNDATRLRSAWDDGLYEQYAGEPCTYGPPEFPEGAKDCSTRHARDLFVTISGEMSPPGQPGDRIPANVLWYSYTNLLRLAGS
jgi:hypothetical protein